LTRRTVDDTPIAITPIEQPASSTAALLHRRYGGRLASWLGD
jgi:hypothetical protein